MNTPGENLLRQYFTNFQIKNTKISETFEDNQVIDIDHDNDLKCRVIHTPGHTEGHCAFYEEKSKIAFFADIDLTRFVFYGGVDSSVIEMVESIEKLKKLDIDIAVTSHHNKIFRGREINEKLDEFHLVIKKRDDRILTRFSETKPINIDDLFKQNLIYRKYSEYESEYEYISERIMVQKHIDKFLKEKKIIRENNGYVLN
jgi:glyoxylase-like metal-dependent hydrolase (beta-lactamase superfamily II)